MNENKVSQKTIGRFYDSSKISAFWNKLKGQHMHVGYWDVENPYKNDLYEGAVRFTDYMIKHVNIAENELFIDIGCGYGVPAAILAQKKRCQVRGVTASKQQYMYAQQYIFENNLQKQVQIQVADARCLPYKNGIFDGGWFFESIFHIGHEQALKEAGRVLKSGAELLIADFIKTISFSKKEVEFMKQDVGITSLVSISEYAELMEKAGFRILEMIDITENTIDKEGKWQAHLQIIEKQNASRQISKEYNYLKSFFTKLHEIGENGLKYYFIKVNKK